MKRMKDILKRFLVWIGAATMLLISIASWGCQKPMDATYAEPNDVERIYISAVESTQAATIPAPVPEGNYVWETASASGNIQIHVDAPVTIPNKPLRVTRFIGDGFTQEQVTGIFNHVFAGKSPTTTDGVNLPTKDEVRAQVEAMKQALIDGTYDTQEFSPEEFQQIIESYEADTENLPDSRAEVIPCDGIMQERYNDAMDCGYKELAASCKEDSSLLITSYPLSANNNWASNCIYTKYNNPYYNMHEAVEIMDSNALPENAAKIAYSFDEAKALADGIVASTGVSTTLKTTYLISDVQKGDVDGIVRDAEQWAYKFVYQRSIDGIPIATDTWDSVGFIDEKIECLVDNSGLAEFTWMSPITTMPDSVGGGETISFDAAKEVFQSTAMFTYGNRAKVTSEKLDHVEYTVQVDDIQLCYMPLSTPESSEGAVVPAWVFYGNIKHQLFWKDGTILDLGWAQGGNGNTNSRVLRGKTIVFALNAIDGSVIDVAQGY